MLPLQGCLLLVLLLSIEEVARCLTFTLNEDRFVGCAIYYVGMFWGFGFGFAQLRHRRFLVLLHLLRHSVIRFQTLTDRDDDIELTDWVRLSTL